MCYNNILSMSKRQAQVKEFAQKIRLRNIKLFQEHENIINIKNKERNRQGNTDHKQKYDQFYLSLNTLLTALNNIQVKLVATNELRAQRRDYSIVKIKKFSTDISKIIKQKNISIKINDSLKKLISDANSICEEVNINLSLYSKQSSSICGKSYDVKVSVEQSLCQLLQYIFLFSKISYFQSVTNDSVKQILLCPKYNDQAFNDLYQLAQKLWPKEQARKDRSQPPPSQKIKFIPSSLQIAHQYLFGFGRPQDIKKALELYEEEVRKKEPDPAALNALASLYDEGKYVPKNTKEAIRCYMRSAEQNNLEGTYRLGKLLQKGEFNFKSYFKGKYTNREAEIRGSMDYYFKAAEGGHLDAATDLGYLYEKGVQGPQGNPYVQINLEQALKYYRMGKEGKHPRAINNLGNLLLSHPQLTKEGKQISYQQGIKCLQEGVSLHYPKAYLNLALCYISGLGVAKNLHQARSLLLKGGSLQCKLQYVKTFLRTSIEDAEIGREIVQLTREVLLVEGKNADALYMMGVCQERGIGTLPNRESSFHYISQAARLQHPQALTKLADFYYSGYYVEKDLLYAQQLYERAAILNEPQALVNLGLMAEKGLLTSSGEKKENNMQHARQYYKKALALGDPNAQFLLDLCDKMHLETALNKAVVDGSFSALKVLHKTGIQFINNTNKENETKKQLTNKYMRTVRGFTYA